MGVIFNIQRYCLHDGDGIRTNVFFKGCPLRCLWCHNPEGLNSTVSVSFSKDKCTGCGSCLAVCGGRSLEGGKISIARDACTKCGKCAEVCLAGANELIGKEMTADEVMAQVRRDKMFYKTSGGGMTLSGGEPSMQTDFALELIRLAKEEGIGTFIETCGIGPRRFYEGAADMDAVFLFDIKCIDPDSHFALTGVANEKILDNLRYLFERNADVIIRLPMIPKLNDTDEDIRLLCEFLKENEGKYRYAEIMPYHTFGTAKAERLGEESKYKATDATSDDKENWVRRFADHGVNVKVSQ